MKLLLLLFTFSAFNCVFSQDKFYNFYSKFPQKMLYNEVKEKFPDIDYKVTIPSEGSADYGPFVDGSVHLIPVGPLQMWGFAISGKDFFVVYHVEPGGVAEKRGIKKWDEICGINKIPFTQKHDGSHMKGVEGPIKELGEALEIAQSRGGLSLTIRRNGKQRRLPIKVEQLGRFTKNYPAKCKKTHKLAKEVAKTIADSSNTGRFHNGNSVSLVGLGLLMNGNPDYISNLEDYILRCLPTKDRTNFLDNKMYVSDGLHRSSWIHAFTLIYLVEYYWATGDSRVVPAIQSFAYAVGEKHQNPFGGSGHHIYGIGNYWDITFGAAGALNIYAMALAEKAGFKVDKPAYKRYWNSITNKTAKAIEGDDNYKFTIDENRYYGAEYFTKVWSGEHVGMGESSFNTAAAILALGHAPAMENSKELQVKMSEHLALVPYSHGYIHTTSGLGNFICALAQSSFNRPGFKKSLDYRKYWLTLSRFPSGQLFYFHPKRARGGWGGDYYLNPESCQYFQTSVFLNGHKRRLLSHGNTRRNWLSGASSKTTRLYLQNYHKFYAADLVSKSKKAFTKKEYLTSYECAKKVYDYYKNTPSYKTAKGLLGRIKKKMGSKKLNFFLTKREIDRYIKFIDEEHEDHSQYGDEVRPKLLKYVARKYKGHPQAKKAEEMITQPFTVRKNKNKDKYK